MCGNDTLAIEFLRVILQRGVRVPEEVSVVGFDGVPEGALYWPGLTTAKQPSQALGSAALAVLPAAIVRDRFGGDQMAKMLSTISVVFMAVPILAPSLGQAILLFGNWRMIFVVMAALAVLVASVIIGVAMIVSAAIIG